MARRRVGEADPQRAERPEALAGAQLAQPLRARSDVLEQEMRLAARPAGDGERAGKVRPLVLSPAPALGCGEHRELARIGGRPVGIGDAQQAVGAQLLDACDRQQPSAEGGLRHR